MPRRKGVVRRRRRGNRLRKQVNKNSRVIKQLRKGQELKYIDFYDTDTAFHQLTDAGNLKYLSTIAHGDTVHTRDADECVMRKIKIRGALINDEGTPTDGICRILVIRVRNPQKITWSLAKTLMNHSAGVGSVFSFLNPDYARMFSVIDDITIAYDADSYRNVPFKITKKLNSILKFDGVNGAYDECLSNALWMLAWTDCPAVSAANAPHIDLEWRIFFIDS